MKSFLILLKFLTVLSVVLCEVDYCEVEKRLCGNKKHIGCDKNVIKIIYFCFKLKIKLFNYSDI